MTVRASRSVQEGVNAGRMDIDFIKAVEISARAIDADRLERWLDQAEATRGWLVFFTHDVSDTPSVFGASTAMLARVVERTQARGIDILPVGAALDRIGLAVDKAGYALGTDIFIALDPAATAQMRAATAESFPDIVLESVADYLVSASYTNLKLPTPSSPHITALAVSLK